MKIICTQENFKRAILNSERVVSKQSTLPILNNILFEAEKGRLRLSATNLEIGVVTKVGAKVEQEGKIAIPAKLISNFVNNLPAGDTISLEVGDQNLKIKSGQVKANIKGLLANDFPLIPKKSTDFLLTLPGEKLRSVIAKVMTSVAISDARQELTGINVIFSSKELLFASTDSFRLTECVFPLEDGFVNKDNYEAFISQRGSIIVPANTISELNRLIPADTPSQVNIALEEGQIFFEVEGTRLVSRLINGKYPEYKHIMPATFKTRAVGERSGLAQAVRMASIFSSGKSSEITLKINAEAKKLHIDGKSVEVGENSSELNFDITGPSQEVIFNSKYLLDGINTIVTPKLAMLINSESTPVGLREIDEKTGEVLSQFTYIVMPIKS